MEGGGDLGGLVERDHAARGEVSDHGHAHGLVEPSAAAKDEEDAKRFDLLVLRRQLAQIEGDAVTAERLREQIQAVAAALLGKTTIPSVAQQQELLDDVASDGWWVDVTLPMLELARLRIRDLVRAPT